LPVHTINKDKVTAELNKRGWKRGQYGEWIVPGKADIEKDWMDSIMASINCEHENRIKDNLKFLEEHPTVKRMG
jgi:hypothetical protein